MSWSIIMHGIFQLDQKRCEKSLHITLSQVEDEDERQNGDRKWKVPVWCLLWCLSFRARPRTTARRTAITPLRTRPRGAQHEMPELVSSSSLSSTELPNPFWQVTPYWGWQIAVSPTIQNTWTLCVHIAQITPHTNDLWLTECINNISSLRETEVLLLLWASHWQLCWG